MPNPANILKVRDDRKPVGFDAVGEAGEFKFDDDTETPSWSNGTTFRYKELRQRIEPWLSSLFQSEHLSMLAGS